MATSSTSSTSGTGILNSHEQVVYLNSCLEKLNADSECGIAQNADPKCGITQDSFRVIKKVSAPTENIDEVMIKLAAPILAISFLKEIPLLDVPLLRNLKNNLTSFYIKSKLADSPIANRIYALLLEDVQMKLAYRFCVADNEFPNTFDKKCGIIEELIKIFDMDCNLWDDEKLLVVQEALTIIAFQRQIFELSSLSKERDNQIDIMGATVSASFLPAENGYLRVPTDWDPNSYLLMQQYERNQSYESLFNLLKYAVELDMGIKCKGLETVIIFLQIQLCKAEQSLNSYYRRGLLVPCMLNFMKRHTKYNDLCSPLIACMTNPNEALAKYEKNYPIYANHYLRGINKLKEYGVLKNIPISELLISPWEFSIPFVSLSPQQLEPISHTASSSTLFYCSQEIEKLRNNLIQQKLSSSSSSSSPPPSPSLSSSPPPSSSSSPEKLNTKVESKEPKKASSGSKTKEGITSKPSFDSTSSSSSSSSSSSPEKWNTKVWNKKPKMNSSDLKTSSITSKPKPLFDSTPLTLPFTYAKRVKDWFIYDRNNPEFPLNNRDEYAAVHHNEKIADKIIAAHTFPKAIDLVAEHIGIRGTYTSQKTSITYETITLLAQIEDADKNLSRRELITYGFNPKSNKLTHRSLSLNKQPEKVEAEISQCMKKLAWPSLKNITAMKAKIAEAKPILLNKLRASDDSRLIEIDLHALVFHRPKDKLTIRVMNPHGIDRLETLLAMLRSS